MKKQILSLLFLLLALAGKAAIADCTFSQVERQCIVDMVYHEARGQPPNEWPIIADTVCGRKLSHAKYHSASKHACDIVKSPEYHSSGKLLNKKTELGIYKAISKAIFEIKSFKGSYTKFSHAKKGRVAVIRYSNFSSKGGA